MNESECLSIMLKLSNAINYCHSKGITHRDIKLENIILDIHKNPKFIDFGFSVCSDDKLKVFCGTPTYMAPEIVSKKEYYGKPSDIWSLGVCLYTLLVGHFPFQANSEYELFKKITKGIFQIPPNLSANAKNLIKRMLTVDPSKRITSSQVY